MRPDNVTGKVRKRAEAFGRVDPDRAEREGVVKRRALASRAGQGATTLSLTTGMTAAIGVDDLLDVPFPVHAVAEPAVAGLGLDLDSEMTGTIPAASPADTLTSPEALRRRTGSATSSPFSVNTATPHDIRTPVGRAPSPYFGAIAAAAVPSARVPISVPTPTRVRAPAAAVAPAPARVLLLAAQDFAPDLSGAASLPALSDSASTWARAVREPLPRSFAAPQIGLNLAAPARREGFIPTGIPLSGARGIFYVPKARTPAAERLESESIDLGFEF